MKAKIVPRFSPRRRALLGLMVAGLLPARAPLCAPGPIRIGITPVFLTEHTSLLRDWRDYLETKLRQPVTFVQRDTYREIVDNLLARRIEFAWLCGYPYVMNRAQLRLTAVPVYAGQPLYQAYLIVPADDTETRRIHDLRDRVFAYADPDSNSGFLVPRYQLASSGVDPAGFFRKTFFTAGHRNVVEAVTSRLADGGSVDGYVWDTLARFEPAVTARTRIVERSPGYGFPPIVAGPGAPGALVGRMRAVLVAMAGDREAEAILDRLNLDGFVAGDTGLYDPIAAMAETMAERTRDP